MSNQPYGFAEYPRPSSGPGFNPYGRGPGVYFETIGESFDLVKSDLGTWAAATILYYAIGLAISLPVNMALGLMVPSFNTYGRFDVIAIQIAIGLLINAVQGCIVVGMMQMGVRKSRGEYIDIGMVFEPFRRFGLVLGASLLYAVALYLSAAACLLPFFFFAPVLVLTPMVAYMKGLGPVDALKTTFQACKAHWIGLFGLCFVLWLLQILGGCACLIGTLVTWPMLCVVLGLHYRAFFESEPAPVAAV